MTDINITILRKVVKTFPPEQSILIRGPHGIGKSAVTKALGEELNIPVIDLRLSQMTEGDFLGLPKLFDPVETEDGTVIPGRTEFMPPAWYVQAMSEPCVLLLDELNRATPELMQCAFQLVLDRAIQGKKLHPETRVVAAVNNSHHYQVGQIDPALLNRFWVCDLRPSLKDWLKWATDSGVDDIIIDFCRQHKDHWWYEPSKGLDPNKVYPTPRGWDMVNRALSCQTDASGTRLIDKPLDAVTRHIVLGLVGLEAGMAFIDFHKNYDRVISADDVLKHYTKKVKPRVEAGVSVETIMGVNRRLLEHAKTNKWSKRAVANVDRWLRDIDNLELAFAFWNELVGTDGDLPEYNTKLLHKKSRDLILKALGAGSAVQNSSNSS